MKLFKSNDGFTVEIEPELYQIKEFAELLESRKKNLSLLYKELSYIYFYSDMTSDFQFQTNELERHNELKHYLGLPSTWKKDKLIEEAIEAYKYLSQTPSSRLLQSAYVGAEKLKKQLEEIDLNERDKNGKPIWNIKQFNDTLKAIAQTVEELDKAEKQFIRSQKEVNKKTKTNQSLYDGLDMSKV